MARIILSKNCCDCAGLTDPCAPCEETECCMYPAEAFNSGEITINDLPDSIAGYGNKNNPPISNPLPDGTPFLVYYGFSGEGVGIQNGNSPWTNRQDFGTGEADECLFRDVAVPLFQDTFNDTYTVTHPHGSGSVVRTSLCVWEGKDNNGCPLYLEYRPEDPFAFKWVVTWTVFIAGFGCETSEAGPKAGPQNSPIGTYKDPNAGSTATVS